MMFLAFSFILILVGIVLFYLKIIFRYFNHNYPIKLQQDKCDWAILIPAKDESKVIEKLLLSIFNQTLKIGEKDIYVIVESMEDKTVDICNKYHVNIILREKLQLRRKGYALMEAIEKITQMKEYDAYFIFDADNILDKNYFQEMKKTYLDGYDMGIGYRNIKNKDNAIAVSSSLIFTIINVLSNRNRSRYSLNCNASGTGFYISGKVINQLKTYPFHSLTEDYELSIYACVHNLTTYYNHNAIFYDEQPTNIKTYCIQRTRWIAGYFEARKKYLKEMFHKFSFRNPNFASIYTSIIGIYDILLMLIGILLLIVYLICNSQRAFLNIMILLLGLYFSLVLFTIYLLIIEKRYQLNFNLKLKTCFLHPMLLFFYIPCLFKVLFSREIEWERIEHNK